MLLQTLLQKAAHSFSELPVAKYGRCLARDTEREAGSCKTSSNRGASWITMKRGQHPPGVRASLRSAPAAQTLGCRHTLRVQGDHLAAELVELLLAHHVASHNDKGGKGAARAWVARHHRQAAAACTRRGGRHAKISRFPGVGLRAGQALSTKAAPTGQSLPRIAHSNPAIRRD